MGENDIADFTLEETTVLKHEQGLAVQNLAALILDNVTAETFEVMSRQATMNVGTIGHVAHGKSTVVKAISGVKTQKFIREAIMNITIHLGYANAKVYQCGQCEGPTAYHAFPSSHPDQTPCPTCGSPLTLRRHFSFVDCPGHNVLMATMLNGAAIMDAALLLIAANESFPQPQTLDHLKAVEIMKLRNILVLQNKIDLVPEVHADDQYRKIRSYLDGTICLSSPIIPISAQLVRNMDVVLEYLCHIPLPVRQLKCPARMTVVRSFDVNKPSDDIENLRGGVAGGSVMEGILKLNQMVEIRPGQVHTQTGGTFSCTPLRTRILTLMAESNPLQYAIPGGLIAVGTTLDPTLTRQNKLVGQMIGDPDSLPEVFSEIEVQYFLFTQLVGTKRTKQDERSHSIQRLSPRETLQINVGTLTAGATVVQLTVEPDVAKLQLVNPVCCRKGDQVAISRLVEKYFRLIGWGTIRRGTPIKLN